MSGANGFDLTTLVNHTYDALNVGNLLFDPAASSIANGTLTFSSEFSNQGETRSGLTNQTFLIMAATNGPTSDDPNSVGSLFIQESKNGLPVGGPFIVNVLGYTADAFVIGTPGTRFADGHYETYLEFSDVNIGVHASDNPNPPVFPQTFFSDPAMTGFVPPACFAAGTPIATPAGERMVETLRAGDRVLTEAGATLTVRWVGHRRVVIRTDEERPVRIAADTFGPGRPHCAVTLSPDHAVFVDDVLVPIHLLVDGVRITRAAPRQIDYHHVELDRHDVLLAAGLPAESYLDTGNRRAFAEGDAGVVSLHPDFLALSWEAACAPLVLHGAALDALRARLAGGASREVAVSVHHV